MPKYIIKILLLQPQIHDACLPLKKILVIKKT
jgi:hypothetical protein